MKNKFSAVFFMMLVLLIKTYAGTADNKEIVNPAHLNHLYEEINAGGRDMAIIHIYSDYPDYKWVGDDDEGIACVDDAARALIFYLQYYKINGDEQYLVKVKKLTEFLLYMQADNGFFYNFIWPDYTKNKTYRTSVADANWWTWRALWALTDAYDVFTVKDAAYAAQIKQTMEKTIDAIKKIIPEKKEVKKLNNYIRPDWLPLGSAADQASIIIMALSNYCTINDDPVIRKYMCDLCDGLLLMQEGGGFVFPYGAILSWENSWHAWGSSQSYALLKAYEITKDVKYLGAAIDEINGFYNYLLRENFTSEFSLKKVDSRNMITDEKRFPQIAYGIRPMIYAMITAAEIKSDTSYAVQAAKAAGWFFGNNPAKKAMYDTKTGVCFDGILSTTELNKNSGAESTIEALLSLLMIQNNHTSLNYIHKKILNNQQGK